MSGKEDRSEGSVSDAELLQQMAVEPRGSDQRIAAWREFYERHHRYVYAVCRQAYSETLGENRIEELVQDTFVRAYEKAATYRPGKEVDRVLGRRQLRAWLGKISENIVHDYYRHEPQFVFAEEDELVGHQEQQPEETTSSEALQRLQDALAHLTEREQEILRVTAMWYKPGEQHQRLPNNVMKTLASSLQMSSDAIRQARSRALAKLKAALNTPSPSIEKNV